MAGYNNYSFVIDSHFQPFSLQEMLTPFAMYKDVYEKMEDEYTDLSDKADTFKYLSETLPEDSKARKLYENYANDLKVQAEDLVKNGLNIRNRKAISGLRQRYQGEIGRLARADAALKEEQKLRRQMNAKDSSMLYGVDNLGIDDFLDENQPNLYSISGNELYTRGAQAGRAASSRMYDSGDGGSTLGGYYRKWVDRVGVSPDSIAAFMNSPEVRQEVDNILAGRGVTQNLSGANLERARQEVMNGIYEGIVYQESVKPMRDAGVLSASEQQSLALQRQGLDRQAAAQGLQYDPETKTFKYMGTANDPKYQMWEAQKQWELEHGVLDKKKENSSNKGKNVKGEKWTPKTNWYIKTDGEQGQYSTGTVAHGQKVAYDSKLIEKYPELVNFEPGYQEYYDYYELDGVLHPVWNGRKPEEEEVQTPQSPYDDPNNAN